MTLRLALINCLALGVAIAMAASCREAPAGPFTYPPSWPIEALKVPGSAAQINVPDDQGGTTDKLLLDGELLQAGTRFEHREWQVAFNCQLKEQELVSFFDELLRTEKLLLLRPGVPKYGKRVYISKDNKQQVSFEWQDSRRADASSAFKGYVLTVSVYTESQIDISGARPIPAHGKAPADKWAF